MPMQLRLFIKNSYFWFLIVIALGGVAGAGWRVSIPLEAGNFMAVFQVSCSCNQCVQNLIQVYYYYNYLVR